MKESLWGYYLVLLGIAVSTFMIMVSNMTTTNQQNYYLLKEVTNAAMIDAIDYAYYREYGEMKINTEKFVENFLRRFSEGISKTNTYKIDFYSIYENPPSVSIRITSNTGDYTIAGDSTNMDVINSYDAILEANNEVTFSEIYLSVPWVNNCDRTNSIDGTDDGYCRYMNRMELDMSTREKNGDDSYIVGKIREKLDAQGIKNIEVDVDNIEVINSEFLYITDNSTEIKKELEGVSDVVDGSGVDVTNKNKFYNYAGSNADVKTLVAGAGEAENPYTGSVQNVNLGVVKKNEKFYLAYGLEYKCGEQKYDRWRLKKYYFNSTNHTYKNESEYNSLSNEDKVKYTNLLDTNSQPSGANWPPEVTGNIYSNFDDSKKALYEKAPYYGACLIGVWYKVNFRYNLEN